MAVRFDSSADALTRSTNLPTNGAATIMAWFKISVDRNTFSSALVLKHATAGGYSIGTDIDGTTHSLFLTGGNVNGTALTVGTWYHTAFVIDGTSTGNFKGYLNGVLDITTGATTGSLSEIRLATRVVGGSEWLNGCLAAVKIYDAALTAAEINAERFQIAPMRWENLNSFFPLFTAADAATDYSGYGRNLTVAGTLATEDAPPIPWRIGRTRYQAQVAAPAPATGQPASRRFALMGVGNPFAPRGNEGLVICKSIVVPARRRAA